MPPRVSANGPGVKYLADRYRSALVADSGEDGGQPERIAGDEGRGDQEKQRRQGEEGGHHRDG